MRWPWSHPARTSDALEATKLRLEIDRENRAFEREKREDWKRELEIRDLERRSVGREPGWGWRVAQHIAIMTGVTISVGTLYQARRAYQTAIEAEARRDFQAAVTHFSNGWDAGVSELLRHGASGRSVLVGAIDGTGKRTGERWPRMTLIILRELEAAKKEGILLEDRHLHTLKEEAALTALSIRSTLDDLQPLLLDGGRPDPIVVDRVFSQACIGLMIIRLSNQSAPDQWSVTLGRVAGIAQKRPDC